MASEVLGPWSRSKFHMRLNHASAKREPKFFDIMTSEPHQNIFFGGRAQWYLSIIKNIGGGGAQWYPRSNTNSGGLNYIRAPQKYRGAPWCYPSPTKTNWGGGGLMISEPHQYIGGGAQRYIWAPPKYGGGGVLNDIRVPPKYLGVSMISEIHQIYWGGQWYLSPIKLLGGSMTSEPHQNIGGGGSMISEPHQNIGGLNEIWAPPKYWGGAQWYLSPIKNIGGGGGSTY